MTILQNIKKLFVCVIFMVVIASPVFADVMPYYSGSILKNTIGFLQVPQKFNVYLYPREDSTIIDNVSWTNTEVKLLTPVFSQKFVLILTALATLVLGLYPERLIELCRFIAYNI